MRHTASPSIVQGSPHGVTVSFDVEPIPGSSSNPEFGQSEYESVLVKREQYRIILDHIVLDDDVVPNDPPTESSETESTSTSRPYYQINWHVDVRHPRLGDHAWTRIIDENLALQTETTVLRPSSKGIALDWLELGGEARVGGTVRRSGELIGRFEMRHSPLESLIEEAHNRPPAGAIILEDDGDFLTVRARLARLTSVFEHENDWLRVTPMKLEISDPADFDAVISQFSPGDEAALRIVVNGHTAYLEAFEYDQVQRWKTRASLNLIDLGGQRAAIDLYFPAVPETPPSVTISISLGKLDLNGTFSPVETITEIIERDTDEHTQWYIPEGVASARIFVTNEESRLKALMKFQNKVFDPTTVDVERRPKPYRITLEQIDLVDDKEPWQKGKPELYFEAEGWTETDGISSIIKALGEFGEFNESSPATLNLTRVERFLSAPVGSTLHVQMKGEELDWPDSDDNLDRSDFATDIPAGDDIDGRHWSGGSNDFKFSIQLETVSKPSDVWLSTEPSPRSEDGTRILELLQSESWELEWQISWAEEVWLETSSGGATWSDERQLTGLRDSITVEPPDVLHSEQFIRIRALNAAGQRHSEPIEIRYA